MAHHQDWERADDADLLRGIVARQEPAFAVFYRRHLPRVLAYLLRETGDRETTADLAAEVFAAVMLAAGRYRPDAWGVWQRPESELNVLGDVAGRDVLELGCGAAQWSIALRERGHPGPITRPGSSSATTSGCTRCPSRTAACSSSCLTASGSSCCAATALRSRR
ncbi:MAG: RNA polymerase sigma factor [Solirubrobacteraceae bacterium]